MNTNVGDRERIEGKGRSSFIPGKEERREVGRSGELTL
jgi:hypothetical protein